MLVKDKFGFRKAMSGFILLAFLVGQMVWLTSGLAAGRIGIPLDFATSVAFQPPVLRGMTVHPENPFLFDFIVDRGQERIDNATLKNESTKLIKYFLASITIPDKDAWVNLSPYEKDRIVPDALGQTEMGRQMLEQDYVLKQLAASLTNPDTDLGKRFWDTVNERSIAVGAYCNTPLQNKVWIVPDGATVVEKDGFAYITESKLKVMLDEEYENNAVGAYCNTPLQINRGSSVVSISTAVFRELILPKLIEEVNTGKNFAATRQVYQSVILAAWYKKALKDSLFSRIYTDKSKVAGLESDVQDIKQEVYEKYLEAFKNGAYNLIKEEDGPDGEMIPRKYFSGGEVMSFASSSLTVIDDRGRDLAVRAISDLQENQVVLVSSRVSESHHARKVNPAEDGFVNIAKTQEVNLAEDLSPEEFKSKWRAYLTRQDSIFPDFEHKEHHYQPLLDLFTLEVKQILLDDPSLRPQFLQSLPDHSVGDMVVNNNRAVEYIDGKPIRDYIKEHRGFLIGNAEVALRALRQNPETKIFIGITDRFSSADETFSPGFRVANGRQAYASSWFSIKGSGQYVYEDKPPFFSVKSMPELLRNPELASSRNWGLASEKEAKAAMAASKILENTKGLFVEILGYQYLNEIPDGNGNLVSVKNLDLFQDEDGSKFIPVLIFNRVVYPQRLTKFRQILNGDPGFERLRRRISRRMVELNMLPAGKILSVKELILAGVEKRALAEAEKQNKQLFKKTIHPQDIVFPFFQESDNEEFLSYNDFVVYVEKGKATEKDIETLRKYRISTAGMLSVLEDIKDIVRYTEPDQKYILPSSAEMIQTFFQTYFAALDKEYLEYWAKGSSESVLFRPFAIKYWFRSSWKRVLAFNEGEVFAKASGVSAGDKMYELIFAWARNELSRRVEKNVLDKQKDGVVLNAVNGHEAAFFPAVHKNLGGINFDPSKLNLQIEGDEDRSRGHLSFSQKDLEDIHVNGFYPVILNIMPINVQTVPILSEITN